MADELRNEYQEIDKKIEEQKSSPVKTDDDYDSLFASI
jgi:hypothetical protein